MCCLYQQQSVCHLPFMVMGYIPTPHKTRWMKNLMKLGVGELSQAHNNIYVFDSRWIWSMAPLTKRVNTTRDFLPPGVKTPSWTGNPEWIQLLHDWLARVDNQPSHSLDGSDLVHMQLLAWQIEVPRTCSSVIRTWSSQLIQDQVALSAMGFKTTLVWAFTQSDLFYLHTYTPSAVLYHFKHSYVTGSVSCYTYYYTCLVWSVSTSCLRSTTALGSMSLHVLWCEGSSLHW